MSIYVSLENKDIPNSFLRARSNVNYAQSGSLIDLNCLTITFGRSQEAPIHDLVAVSHCYKWLDRPYDSEGDLGLPLDPYGVSSSSHGGGAREQRALGVVIAERILVAAEGRARGDGQRRGLGCSR